MKIAALFLLLGGALQAALATPGAPFGSRALLNAPDAIIYALFGGGLIAVAVLRRRRT
ncbi:MAG TPA: hypothetical protein VFA28_12560 [Bryobacteraceae bacterium]|nr:hypothetical protein [Bryobacteraceae bacterium]